MPVSGIQQGGEALYKQTLADAQGYIGQIDSFGGDATKARQALDYFLSPLKLNSTCFVY